MMPRARTEKLTIRELPDETLVYDLPANKVHCLNRSSAIVWRHCDGRTSATELARILSRELGRPAEDSVVELALEQLHRRNLLETPLTLAIEEKRRSRRLALQRLVKLGAAAAAIPMIMTVTAKSARAAQSGVSCTKECTYNASGRLANSSAGFCATGVCAAAQCPQNGPANSSTFINGTCGSFKT